MTEKIENIIGSTTEISASKPSKEAARARRRFKKAEELYMDTLSSSYDWIRCIRVAKKMFRKALAAYEKGAISRAELEAAYQRLRETAREAVNNTCGDQNLRAAKYQNKISYYMPESLVS